MSSANDTQVGGDHYKDHIYEHWDIVEDWGLDYFQGQITKYVMRWKSKNGVEDLMKARHFLEKYIEIQVATCRNNDYKVRPAGEEPGEPGRGYVDQD
jgi:hypothetical protein